jgi:hypothetical protein
MQNESPKGLRLGFRLKATAVATLIVLATSTCWIWVARAKADAPATAPAAMPMSTPAAAPASQPALPTYFAGLSAPDPTGNNYGVWATPSGKQSLRCSPTPA